MMLLIDAGNTRLKWATLSGDELSEQQALPHAQLTTAQFIEQGLATLPAPERVLASNVAGERVAAVIREAVGARWKQEVRFVDAQASAGGVRNAYREPHKLGVDRWLALLAAHRLVVGAACVVSIGTAMTIDALDASGQHLGGLITPGPQLMMDSLFRNTSDIAPRAVDAAVGASFFADHTRGAVEQGAVQALGALIERAVVQMQALVNEPPALILTGGAGARVSGAVPRAHQIVPDLVLRGLAVLAREQSA